MNDQIMERALVISNDRVILSPIITSEFGVSVVIFGGPVMNISILGISCLASHFI